MIHVGGYHDTYSSLSLITSLCLHAKFVYKISIGNQ